MKKTLGILAMTVTVATSFGEVLFQEEFSYTDGVLTNVSGDAWVEFSGSDEPSTPTVLDGAVVLSRSNTDDVYRQGSATQISSGMLYYAFDFTMTTAPASLSTGYYFAGLARGTTTLRDRLYVTTDGATTGDFQIGVGNNSLGVRWNLDLDLNTTYRIVVGADLDSDTTYLWINPDSELSTSVSFVDDDTYAVQGLAFRQDTGIGISTIDNVVLTDTFVQAVPEPAVISLLGAGGLITLLARRFYGRHS